MNEINEIKEINEATDVNETVAIDETVDNAEVAEISEPQSEPLEEALGENTDKDAEQTEPDALAEARECIDALRSEIERLQGEVARLEELKRAQNRILAEIGDFVALFPDTPIETIPDTVWESVKGGAPLAAAFALYEKRMVAEAKRIAEINAKNAKRSPGAAGKDTAGEYFSPEDVRRMSRAEVHANYSKIKDSMKKWM